MNIIIQKGFNYGDVVIFKLHLPDENHIDFTNYHLSKQMHERCFNTAVLPIYFATIWKSQQRTFRFLKNRIGKIY